MSMGRDQRLTEIVLAEIDLSGCPVGDVLDARDSVARAADDRFHGWRNNDV